MYVNEDNKYTSPGEYYYNPYIDLYCLVDTTIATESAEDIINLFDSPALVTEIDLPDYITSADYDAPSW